MSIRLRELIRNVRACKTQADERACIHKECASIRTAFKEESNELRHRNVAKLLFIHMLGYPTHWGQMECLKLIAGAKFLEKRIGYLGLMILLDERQEVLMLVENSLKNDLQSQNQYIAGLACCSIGNISSAEICRDLSPEVEKLMVGSNPFVAKKAALCSIRILRKCPELVDTYVDRVGTLLGSRNHAVLLTALKLMREMCLIEAPMVEQLRRHTSTLIAALKNLVLSGYAPEHDVHGIVDPFLQVEILRMLRILGAKHADTSDQMNDILAQVATNTESAKNAGNAILYECVLTIMAIDVESGLRVLAINILGRFLINRDNNIRYVALNTLHKVVGQDPQAVQRHRNTIVDCLKDNDSSIRQRALELVYALVNEANVKVLVKELLSYLMACDVEFKDELTQRICHVVEKYATDKEWHVDTIIQTLLVSTNFTSEETVGRAPRRPRCRRGPGTSAGVACPLRQPASAASPPPSPPHPLSPPPPNVAPPFTPRLSMSLCRLPCRVRVAPPSPPISLAPMLPHTPLFAPRPPSPPQQPTSSPLAAPQQPRSSPTAAPQPLSHPFHPGLDSLVAIAQPAFAWLSQLPLLPPAPHIPAPPSTWHVVRAGVLDDRVDYQQPGSAGVCDAQAVRDAGGEHDAACPAAARRLVRRRVRRAAHLLAQPRWLRRAARAQGRGGALGGCVALSSGRYGDQGVHN